MFGHPATGQREKAWERAVQTWQKRREKMRRKYKRPTNAKFPLSLYEVYIPDEIHIGHLCFKG